MNNLRAVDLNLLVILDALLSERHLSRAAERLHMSQPAVSHALGRLRHLLDDPLLVRGRGGFQPTTRALELSRPLADALQHVRSVLGGAVFDAATARRTFRLAMSDYGAAIVLPALMRHLRQEAPGIDVKVAYGSRESMLSGIVDGELDVALGVFPQVPAVVRSAALFTEQFVCGLDPASLAPDQALDLPSYLARPHVLVASGEGTEIDAALLKHGHVRRIALRLPHWAVAPRLLLGTDMVLTVARRALPAAAGLKIMAPPFDIAPFVFEQVWHQRTTGDAGLAWLRTAVQRAALDDA